MAMALDALSPAMMQRRRLATKLPLAEPVVGVVVGDGATARRRRRGVAAAAGVRALPGGARLRVAHLTERLLHRLLDLLLRERKIDFSRARFGEFRACTGVRVTEPPFHRRCH